MQYSSMIYARTPLMYYMQKVVTVYVYHYYLINCLSFIKKIFFFSLSHTIHLKKILFTSDKVSFLKIIYNFLFETKKKASSCWWSVIQSSARLWARLDKRKQFKNGWNSSLERRTDIQRLAFCLLYIALLIIAKSELYLAKDWTDLFLWARMK